MPEHIERLKHSFTDTYAHTDTQTHTGLQVAALLNSSPGIPSANLQSRIFSKFPQTEKNIKKKNENKNCSYAFNGKKVFLLLLRALSLRL